MYVCMFVYVCIHVYIHACTLSNKPTNKQNKKPVKEEKLFKIMKQMEEAARETGQS